MKIKELNNLIYSPNWIGTLLYYFISGAQSINERGIKLELIYLLIPIVNNKTLINKLDTAKKTSTFETIFNDNYIKNSIIDINKAILTYKTHSNHGLIALSNIKKITITDMITLNGPTHYKNEKNESLKKIYKSCYNLGIIFAKEEPYDILLKVGLK